MSVDIKGRAIITDSPKGGQGARVINGCVLVRFVPRTPPGPSGYGSAAIKGGIASKGEAQVISGAVKVRIC